MAVATKERKANVPAKARGKARTVDLGKRQKTATELEFRVSSGRGAVVIRPAVTEAGMFVAAAHVDWNDDCPSELPACLLLSSDSEEHQRLVGAVEAAVNTIGKDMDCWLKERQSDQACWKQYGLVDDLRVALSEWDFLAAIGTEAEPAGETRGLTPPGSPGVAGIPLESVVMLAVADIDIPKRLRQLDEAKAKKLAESIRERGVMLQPIGVSEDGWLVFGRHRLRAAQILGWEHVPARLLPYGSDSPQARIDEVDENVCRAELTALELAEAMAARKAAWLELHPETAVGKKGGRKPQKEKVAKLATNSAEPSDSSSRPVPTLADMCNDSSATAFAKDASKRTGKSERTVRRAAAIGQKLDQEVKQKIAKTPVADNQRELEKLARLDPDMQRTVADMLIDGEVESVTEALAEGPGPEAAPAEEASAVLRELLRKLASAWKASCGRSATGQLGAAVLEAVADEWMRETWWKAEKRGKR
jgi:ParB family transcriptional regulator, chromosome partitioning protein